MFIFQSVLRFKRDIAVLVDLETFCFRQISGRKTAKGNLKDSMKRQCTMKYKILKFSIENIKTIVHADVSCYGTKEIVTVE